jgi:two-component system sensor histidine kinase KdpD
MEAQLDGRPVRTDLPADLPLVSADAVLLEQVFVNLLENAAKYTPPGSPVEIAARPEAGAGGIVIEVADRGPGIAAGDEARLFDKFFRGTRAGSSGAGLGLAICRGVISAHGGTIAATNRPGGGAMFRMTLPIVGAPPPAPSEPSTSEP